MIQHIQPAKRTGIIQIPPSKSDSQRAFLCAGLAAGKSRIFFSGKSNDELKMLNAIQHFGAKVTNIDATTIEITGTDDFPSKLTLNAGESGLSVRLLTSICAAHDGEFTLVGEGSLECTFSRRNSRNYTSILNQILDSCPLLLKDQCVLRRLLSMVLKVPNTFLVYFWHCL
ncbi:MAG: 3-phosphoshikimate 1-carboxyvinyltransferase [Bacteroidota bacterium]